MSPWLIVTTGWPAATAAAAILLARATAHPVTDAIVATSALALVGGALLGLRTRQRPGRRSTS